MCAGRQEAAPCKSEVLIEPSMTVSSRLPRWRVDISSASRTVQPVTKVIRFYIQMLATGRSTVLRPSDVELPLYRSQLESGTVNKIHQHGKQHLPIYAGPVSWPQIVGCGPSPACVSLENRTRMG
nr:hypothetical protein CFP56_69164 [Quercus suber]